MPLEKFVVNSFLPYSQQLYSYLSKDYANSNCFVSPLSIYCGLSLALCGTDGKSFNDILGVLRVIDDKEYERALVYLGGHQNDISLGDTNKTLVLANGLFLESTFESSKLFRDALDKHFHTELHQVEFKSNAEATRKQINEWVANNTGEKITNLMPQGSIDCSTCLVLANAIYFKGTWEEVFHRHATMKAPFQTLHGDKVEALIMKRNGVFAMADFGELNATALKIPFKCHEMLVVLPYDSAGLVKLLETISDPREISHFNALFDKGRYSMDRVELYLPKFKLGGGKSVDLKKTLSAMGLGDLFDPQKADFNRITKATRLGISAMLHQAVIEVNEEGAEAAAATGMSIAPMSLVPAFNVDHPFLFFIVMETGVPVFMGHVVNPVA